MSQTRRVDSIHIGERQRKKIAHIKELAKSIADVGLLHPIVIAPDGKLIAGQRRLLAVMELGWAEVPVTVIDLDDPLLGEYAENVYREDFTPTEAVAIGEALEAREREKARERMVAGRNQYTDPCGNFPQGTEGKTRDKVGEAVGLSGKSYEKAKQVVEAAEEEPEIFGDLPELMDEKSIDRAYKELNKRKQEIEASIPEPQIPETTSYNVEYGQVWKCGKHTVICGNCIELIQELKMNIDAVITDPPYGIDYKPDWNKWDGRKSDYKQVIGDDTIFNPQPFLHYPTVLLFGANYFSDQLPIGGWLCWDKRTKEELDAMFGSPFELAWYRSQHTARRAIMIRLQHGGVVNADSRNGNNEKRYHPTQKPIYLMQQIIEQLTEKDEIILDPYAGVGSTLLACENTGNINISIEIDAENVAIILQRYEEEAGEKPCLESHE